MVSCIPHSQTSNSLVWIGFLVYCLVAVARVGHYCLWDDEANTALGAKGFLLHGDTDARVDDRNVLLYREGMETKNLKLRYIPPLQYLVAAVGIAGDNTRADAARLPFLAAGLVAVAILIAWAQYRSPESSAVFTVLVLANVSLLLFLCQCRYPALTVLLATAVAWIYGERVASLPSSAALAACLAALAATHQLICAAVVMCLLVDWGLWGRQCSRWPAKSLLATMACAATICAPIIITWNPFSRPVVDPTTGNTLVQRLVLLFWNMRDMNWCEFGSLPVILGGAWLPQPQLRRKLIRGLTAVLVYVITVSALSPQPVALTKVADVRYLVPVIPLLLWLEALVIEHIAGHSRHLAFFLAAVIGSTNLTNANWYSDGDIHCTVYRFVAELFLPAENPYGVVSEWLNQNAADGASVFVLPGYAAYPLMFHAPHVKYAWQLNEGQRQDPQFASLPDIDFQGIQSPDYIVAFGPHRTEALAVCNFLAQRGCRCEEVSKLPVFWRETYRPELFWRTFGPIRGYDPVIDGIVIIKCAPMREGQCRVTAMPVD